MSLVERRARPRSKSRWIALSFTVVLAHPTGPASGAESDDTLAQADLLFAEARKLIAQGRVGTACRMLEESQRLAPRLGTLLNVAVCHKQEGRTASASREFEEAARLARDALGSDPDRARQRLHFAEENIATLAPHLSRLVVSVPSGAELHGLELRVNGEPLARWQWGMYRAVDPGIYTVVAAAPGKRPWTGVALVKADGDKQDLRVPVLTEGSGPGPAGSGLVTTPDAPLGGLHPLLDERGAKGNGTDGSGTRTAAFVVGGIGLGSLAAGAVAGGIAVAGVHDGSSDPETPATIAAITLGAGVLGVVSGAILLATSPSSTRATAGERRVAGGAIHVSVTASPRGPFAAFQRRW